MPLIDPASLDARIADLKWLAACSDDPLVRVRSLTEICRLRREQYAQRHANQKLLARELTQ